MRLLSEPGRVPSSGKTCRDVPGALAPRRSGLRPPLTALLPRPRALRGSACPAVPIEIHPLSHRRSPDPSIFSRRQRDASVKTPQSRRCIAHLSHLPVEALIRHQPGCFRETAFASQGWDQGSDPRLEFKDPIHRLDEHQSPIKARFRFFSAVPPEVQAFPSCPPRAHIRGPGPVITA